MLFLNHYSVYEQGNVKVLQAAILFVTRIIVREICNSVVTRPGLFKLLISSVKTQSRCLVRGWGGGGWQSVIVSHSAM